MTNKDVTPKVHLFDKLDKLQDNLILMIAFPTGEKYRITVAELKEFMSIDVLKQIKKLEKQTKDIKITRDSIIDAFKKAGSISFGKPFNIIADVGIEKLKTKGIIYSDGKRVRVNLSGKWHTLKLEDGD